MRRFFGFLLTMALLGGGVFWLPYLQAEPVDNVYQAADLLRQDAENGGNGVAFREDNVDADEVYRALEAQYPYAFALHAVTRPNKTIELNAEVSRQARQEQAWEYAKVLTAGSISQTMTAEEKLRALHDTLIRQCEYDVDTAAQHITSTARLTIRFRTEANMYPISILCSPEMSWRRRIPGMRRSTSSFWTVWSRAENSGKTGSKTFSNFFEKRC